ncbi:MAG: succinylglutamate desuccinylase/aspartoacylase family protein [Alphaproteobacteria bacterium]|nr:succinylglutamate desuccinylase/aspartoacylase family protein [Alphaproteobacteria bacterium]
MQNQTKPKPAAKARPKGVPFEIGDTIVAPGTSETVDLPLSLLSTHTPVTLTVRVVNGKRAGPTLFVSAAVHGDEINGVEIIRRVLASKSLKNLRGTLIAAPIVNVFGFISRDRYLPDRRDLNRSFPGSSAGSLAGQLAKLFMSEIVAKSDAGIDLHTGSMFRQNLPQIRGMCEDPKLLELAMAFGAPVVMNAGLRDGSMRKSAGDIGVPVLVYEAGEALRFDELSIQLGVKGVLNTMRHLGMLSASRKREMKPSVHAESSFWERAPVGGIMRTMCALGNKIAEGGVLGVVADPLGNVEVEVLAREEGILIGCSNLPVVNQGDALFHVARVRNPARAVETVEIIQDASDLSEFDTVAPLEGQN